MRCGMTHRVGAKGQVVIPQDQLGLHLGPAEHRIEAEVLDERLTAGTGGVNESGR